MRLLFILYAHLVCISIIAQNQSPIIKGKVTDISTNEPLTGVQVIWGTNRGTITNANGYFELLCDTGKLQLTFTLIGYKSHNELIYISDNKVTDLKIKLEPVINQLDEVVVSANKTEQRISELSVSMNVIKPIEIIRRHMVNAEDLINQTQGIEILDGQASIRGGSGFSYGAGSRVLALIDGLPAISADAGNIRWQFLPLENLSQIEIIKGASSVLYGSSALNGVINFRTAEADTVPQFKFSLLSGIFDKPLQKEWVWWSSARMYSNASFTFSQRYHQTELSLGGNFLTDNGYRRLNDEKLGKINFRIKQHSAKHEGLTYGMGFIGGYEIKQDFILWEDATDGALKQNESTAIQLHASYLTFDPFVSFRSSKNTKQDFRIRFQFSDNRYPDNPANNSRSIANYAEYQLNHGFSEKLGIIVGLSDNYSNIISNFYGNHSGNNLATFAQSEYKALDKLKISAGVRLEYNVMDGKNDKIVPIFRSGINYQAGRSTFIRASFGQGYRYPSIAEKFAYTSLGAVKIYPNPEVLAESGWNSEIGLKQGIKIGKLVGQTDVSVFYSENKDMIEYVFGLFADPNTQQIDFGFRASNIENSRVYGAEWEFSLNRYFGNLYTTFSGGYTYIYPVEFDKISHQNTEVYLKYRRKNDAKLSLNTSLNKFELGLLAFYKSKILNIDEVFLDPLTRESLLPGFYDYWTNDNKSTIVFDGYFSYRINAALKLSFSVKNIGNTEYMGRPGDIQPQRFFSLQLSGKF